MSKESKQDNIVKTSTDWKCQKCQENNFRYRIKCWKCNMRDLNKAKELRYNDWVCVCGVQNFSYRLSCMRCMRSKTDQEKLGNMSGPKSGDWLCPCGMYNFAKRQLCFSCKAPKQNIIEKQQSWICHHCARPNYISRDICHTCNRIRYGIHLTKNQDLCQVCKERPRIIAINKCGHFCLCGTCSLIVSNCPICGILFDKQDTQTISPKN